MTGARERARQDTIAEIKRLARLQIAGVGASSLSMRQIARDMDLVSSALYRYFPSRDELFTALIIDAYDSLGSSAEAARSANLSEPPLTQHLEVWRAVRAWAHASPSEWALIYGSPVPGYRAPDTTIGPATRVAAVLSALLEQGSSEGLLDVPSRPPLPKSVKADATVLAAAVGVRVPAPALLRGVITWYELIGVISAELFGQMNNVISDRDAFFDFSVGVAARTVGLGAS